MPSGSLSHVKALNIRKKSCACVREDYDNGKSAEDLCRKVTEYFHK